MDEALERLVSEVEALLRKAHKTDTSAEVVKFPKKHRAEVSEPVVQMKQIFESGEMEVYETLSEEFRAQGTIWDEKERSADIRRGKGRTLENKEIGNLFFCV